MQEKVQTSLYLEFHLRKKLKRVSKILGVTESSIMEDALEHYFRNSPVIKQAQQKITEYNDYLKSIGATRSRFVETDREEIYEYRPNKPEVDI